MAGMHISHIQSMIIVDGVINYLQGMFNITMGIKIKKNCTCPTCPS